MLHDDFKRPGNKTELENREAAGFWKAIALANDIGKDNRELDLSTILQINKCILEDANPEAAGRFRMAGEDVKKLACVEPPPGSHVQEEMYRFEGDLKHRLGNIPHQSPDERSETLHKKWMDDIFELAAWVQHRLVAIHPFCEANGRTARLLTNIVLKRFGLPSSDVRIEADNKRSYIEALCQIDRHNDYRPLKDLIIRGSLATLKKEGELRLNK